MRRGQFGNLLVDLVVWLMIIIVVVYIIARYIVKADPLSGAEIVAPIFFIQTRKYHNV